jgi:hypothetical protein
MKLIEQYLRHIDSAEAPRHRTRVPAAKSTHHDQPAVSSIIKLKKQPVD